MSLNQMEVLLRPPVELWSGVVAIGAGVILALAPELMMMTSSLAYTMSVFMVIFGIYRCSQAIAIIRYQRNLRRLQRFTMALDKVPTYKRSLYLGRGFKWSQRHSQRLKDTLSPKASQYLEPSKLYQTVRKFERKAEESKLQWLAKLTQSDSPLNPFRPLPPIGGNPAVHGVELKEDEVLLPTSERVGHTLVIGTTRVGKTRLAEIMIQQDIARGEGPVIVFDPKSDAGLLTGMYAAAVREGREDDFYVFHLGFPDISARYNAIGNFARITEVASRISGQLSAEGDASAFKEFAWRFTNIVARALVALGQRPDYNNILRYVVDIEPLFLEFMEQWLAKNGDEGWQREIEELTQVVERQAARNPRAAQGSPRAGAIRKYVEQKAVSDGIVLGLVSALRYDRTYFDKLVASLLPLLEKLTTGKVGKLISPDYLDVNDERPIIEWPQIIRKRGIVYVGLDAMTDTEVASAVGNSMFSDLVSTAGLIYKHGFEHGMLDGTPDQLPKICLHADEFNELMGDEFLPMVNKSGGAGMQITAYTQSRGDIEAKLGDTAKARQVEGNFNNLIMLRVKEKETAELLTNQLSEVEIYQIMSVSGANDSSDTDSTVDFTTSTQDRISALRVPMLEPSHVMALPKGQAFCLLNGGHLWKVRFPLPEPSTEEMPETISELTQEMEKNYHTSESWWKY